jgi:FMNH2-dependent dimethyl sulfone monooxygenase
VAGEEGCENKQGLNLGGNIEIIGSPEYVAEQLVALHKMGIDGVQLCFYDFNPDLEYFGKKILPLLEKAGLRLPAGIELEPEAPSLKRPISDDVGISNGSGHVKKKR